MDSEPEYWYFLPFVQSSWNTVFAHYLFPGLQLFTVEQNILYRKGSSVAAIWGLCVKQDQLFNDSLPLLIDTFTATVLFLYIWKTKQWQEVWANSEKMGKGE